MNIEQKPYGTSQQKSEKESGSQSTTETIKERGAEAYGKAERAVSDAYDKTSEAVSDAYDKTSEKVSETYEKAREYSSEHPGATVLVAFGIGLGLGLLLAAGTTHRSHNRFAQPVINAISGVASELFH
jgi:ElaB/YqjD/DUF883 family membrane-anchored ribosome-binding protein